jgi:hypothetical protein
MRTAVVLAFLLCGPLRLVSQEPQAPAQCKFSDGSTIQVTHLDRKSYKLTTEEDLLTVKGISVPAGDYAVFPARDPQNDSWSLKMRSKGAKGESREFPPVPLSVMRSIMVKRIEPSASPRLDFTVWFDQTGGSCMMHWRSDKPNMVLSLEFTEKNTDLPLQP